jgi:hypothetical protein
MFQLTEQPAKIINHNPRPERHGDELVLAGDLKLQVVCRAQALDAFDVLLRTLLFRERQPGDAQVQADIEGQPGDLETSRRFPQLAPLSWDEKFPGYRLTIVKGMGLVAPIVLAKRELSGFVFEAQDGGLVKISFSAKGVYDTTLASGELDGLQQREVTITLEPPQADAVAETQQGDLLEGDKSVLVTGVEILNAAGGSLKGIKVALAGGADHIVGQWAYEPTLDEIAIALHAALGAAVEFTPACRKAYELATADA